MPAQGIQPSRIGETAAGRQTGWRRIQGTGQMGIVMDIFEKT